MKLVAWTEALAGARKISVDGLVPNALSLTHWPGNDTPPEFRADTTTEIVIRLLESGRFEEVTRGVEILTNNHFDTDGLLPAWLLLHPGADRALFPLLTAAARAGDFGWMDDERAGKFNFLVENFWDETVSPLRARFDGAAPHERDQLSYDALLPLLPDLLFDLDRHRALWEPDWERWLRNREEARAARVAERPDRFFAAIEGPRRLNARVLHTITRMDRILSAWPYGDGWRYEFRYSKYSWYDVTRPHGARREFDPLVRELSAMETAREGRWVNETQVSTEDGFAYRIPTRVFFGERPNVFRTSRIPPARAIEAFLAYFSSAEPDRRPARIIQQ
jgi:hypothetical protein